MHCQICGHRIKLRVTFKNFLRKELQQVCGNCFKKYQNINPYLVIPIDGSVAHVYELLYETFDNLEYFDSYLNPYIISYLAYQNIYTLLIFDQLDKAVYDNIQYLNLGPLIVLTIKIKGELFYEI